MKKIGFISKNKILVQSLAALITKLPDLGFETYLLLSIHQAVLDAQVLGIDVAVVDMIAELPEKSHDVLQICENLRQAVPNSRILLLVPQDIKDMREAALMAVKSGDADDYVFYDSSLDYLLAKLLVL